MSNLTLRRALEMAGMGVWQRDLRTGHCIRSPGIDAMFGFAPGQAGDHVAPFHARIHPDDLDLMRHEIERTPGGVLSQEFRIVQPDGSMRWLSGCGEILLDGHGRPERIVSVIMDITARKRAEQALQSSEEKLRLAIDATDLGLWDYDIATGVLIWSDRLKALYGVPPGAPVDFETFERGIHPDDRDRILSVYERALDPASGGHFRFEHRVIAPDGALRWLLGSGQVVFDAARRPVRAIGTALDITHRKRGEEAQARSEARLRLTLDAARLGTYERDLRQKRGRFSGRGAELHGLPPERPTYTIESWLATIHLDDRRRTAECVAAAVAGSGIYEADYRVVWPDGQIRWVAARGEVIKDATGTPVHVAGIVHDITERKQADETLRANEQWLRLTMAGARVGSWSWEAKTGLITYSDWLCDLFGLPRDRSFSREEMRASRMHPEDRERVREAFDAAVAQGSDYDVEYRVIRPDGPPAWVRAMGRGEYDEAGQPVQVLGIIQDITERKRAEEALSAGEARLRLITDRFPGVITYVDADGCFRFVNTVFEDWYDIARERAVGRPVREVLNEADFDVVAPWVRRALAGEQVMFERTLTPPDRPARHLLVRYFPDIDAGGAVRGFYTLAIDITERRQAEERLKLLAAEVDHRAKNMLALVQIVLRQTRADSVRDFVFAAQGRVAALARAHVVLSEQRWEGADLRRLIEEELAPYRAQTPSRVGIEGPRVALSARAAQSCAMALHELATNAAKYGALSTQEGRVRCFWTAAPRRTVTLTWSESGGPAVAPPAQHGFGMNVIQRCIQEQLEGEVRFGWHKEGLRCIMELPASSVTG